ncbi:hypothetical protein [Streptomyces yunnanensis]|uniref:Uncharacterized protein n=1 Tax=Streptomyces yunnanensis TaxID=156453 RepID=A0A9X8QZL7_9ACTN|nr:hypothetical protein [Streptomyces yunnanensis]SHN24096.1 hypothetical protein SAMN05216268_12665 [Streptomyces yunnanensis]
MAVYYVRAASGMSEDNGVQRPPAPANTTPEHCAPHDMQVGDYVFVDGRNRRVNDMRGRGGASVRVLILEGYGPWTMKTAALVYRPITRGSVRRIA